MTIYQLSEYKTFEENCDWWGHSGHVGGSPSLSLLIRTRDDALLVMQVLCGRLSTLGALGDESVMAQAQIAYEIILDWDSPEFDHDGLCQSALEVLENKLAQLRNEGLDSKYLVTDEFLLDVLIQGVRSRNGLLTRLVTTSRYF